MNEPTSNIGERLRRTRTAMDISLDEASRRTGVSKPMLGQIERGQSVPTITTLWKIATGLKTPLSSFLEEPQSDYAVVDIHENAPVTAADGRMRAYSMFPFDPIRSMEMFFIEFDPDCHHVSEKHNDGVEEYLMVLSGKLELIINDEKISVGKDQAIRFRADIPHEYHNPFPQPCTVYNVIFYPNR